MEKFNKYRENSDTWRNTPFERQTRTRKRPQAGSRLFGRWSFARFTWNAEGYRDALVCFELLRAIRVPGVPRAAKKEPQRKKE